MSNIDNYLSSEAFITSEVYKNVRERCFAFVTGTNIAKAEKLLLSKASSGDGDDFEKLGVWNSQSGFVSPLIISEIFLKIVTPLKIDEEKYYLDESEKVPYAQQIICAGLRDMTEENFQDGHYDITAVENALGFTWGYMVKSVIPNIWLAPQVRTLYFEHKKSGSKPLIDFVFNGRINMGIEIAVNQKASGIREHLERFDNN